MKNESQEDASPSIPLHHRIDWGTVASGLFILAVIGGVAWYFMHQHQTQVREQRTAEIKQQQKDASIAALALKYNAVTNWESSLPDRGGAQPFSIDISRALNIPANPYDALDGTNRPVLIKCNINDIFEKDGKLIASLSSADTINNLSLELQCNPAQAITFASTNQFLSFAVIARCQKVKRLSGDDNGFLVKGELLDAVQLSEHFVSQDASNQKADPDQYEPDLQP